MISLQDFKASSFDRKCNVVTMDADYISMRKLGESKIHLYRTDGFFIEVHYSPREQKVLMIQAFNHVDDMMPYVENVSLADLNL